MSDSTTLMETAWANLGVSEQAAAEAQEADLIPNGTWEGQVIEEKVRIVDRSTHPAFGKTLARLTAELYVDGRTRRLWFDVTPELIFDHDGKLIDASTKGAQLATATGTVGLPYVETIKMSKQVRLKFTVRKGKASNGFPARNWLVKIAKV